jgi:transcription initiation factor TFIIH subunit 4
MSFTAPQRALGYLKGLPGTTFTKLYQQPSTALVVFRRIPPYLAKKNRDGNALHESLEVFD